MRHPTSPYDAHTTRHSYLGHPVALPPTASAPLPSPTPTSAYAHSSHAHMPGKSRPTSTVPSPSSYRTALASPTPASSASRSAWLQPLFKTSAATPPARYSPPSDLAALARIELTPQPPFRAQLQPPSTPHATTLDWVRGQEQDADSRADDFPDEESAPSFRSVPPAGAGLPSYPQDQHRGKGREEEEEDDEGLGEWLRFKPEYHSNFQGRGGDALQHAGVGFASSPALTHLPDGGGRAARIALRKAKLEAKYGKPLGEGVEPEGPEDRKRAIEEALGRKDSREIEWSGADDKGRIRTGKGRTAVRWLQVLTTLAVGLGMIGASLVSGDAASCAGATR